VGTLYLVATPIGNLEDITYRAIRILSSAALIAAEDTRQSRKLLDHYGIQTPLISYHEHNKLSRIEPVLNALATADVALVSDAGTPALNDPGYELVQAVLAAGYPVSPVPGPSAPVAALVASGLPTDAFLYLGYLPRKRSERRATIANAAALPYTLIFLETPHRLLDALKDLRDGLGDRPMAAGRELTKLYEEIFRGTINETIDHFTGQEPRGEFTLVIGGAIQAERWSEAQLQGEVRRRLGEGESPASAAGELAGLSGWPRRAVYRMFLDQEREAGDEPG
jgi:16S rRNA (cytidine1402-2'-O)-methyltransferase